MLTPLISPANQDRIRQFISIFLKRCTDVAVVVPDAMRAGPPNADGWIPWKAVESPVGDRDIKELEQEIGAELPPLFRAYLMYKCLLMTDFFVILPETPFDDPLRKLRQLLELRASSGLFQGRKLVPFGYDADGAGIICFDIERRQLDKDCPVVLIEFDKASQSGYQGQTIATSFASLLDRIEADLLSYD